MTKCECCGAPLVVEFLSFKQMTWADSELGMVCPACYIRRHGTAEQEAETGMNECKLVKEVVPHYYSQGDANI